MNRKFFVMVMVAMETKKTVFLRFSWQQLSREKSSLLILEN